jgi:hypothetical protein
MIFFKNLNLQIVKSVGWFIVFGINKPVISIGVRVKPVFDLVKPIFRVVWHVTTLHGRTLPRKSNLAEEIL